MLDRIEQTTYSMAPGQAGIEGSQRWQLSAWTRRNVLEIDEKVKWPLKDLASIYLSWKASQRILRKEKSYLPRREVSHRLDLIQARPVLARSRAGSPQHMIAAVPTKFYLPKTRGSRRFYNLALPS